MKPRRAREPRLRDPETGEWDVAEVKHRTKGWVAVVLALVIVFGGIWFVGGKAWDAWMSFRTKDDYIGAGVDPIQVEIPRGATMTAVGKLLEEKDVVKSADSFRRYAQSRPDESSRVQAGRYNMKTQMSVIAASCRSPACVSSLTPPALPSNRAPSHWPRIPVKRWPCAQPREASLRGDPDRSGVQAIPGTTL